MSRDSEFTEACVLGTPDTVPSQSHHSFPSLSEGGAAESHSPGPKRGPCVLSNPDGHSRASERERESSSVMFYSL